MALEVLVDDVVARARWLLTRAPRRVIIGIVGAPGAGKTTLTEQIVSALPGAVAVGLDGFHLAHSVLESRADVDRKGALDTFDGDGYLALLDRIHQGSGRTIWAPAFRREIEDAISCAVAVEPNTELVVTEGNYLLVDEPPWTLAAALCDEVWYIDVEEELRLERLAARHVQFGRTVAQAWYRATTGSDSINAQLIRDTRKRADVLVHGH